MPISAGTRFGSYEVKGLLGVGGMGEVYRATDTKLGRSVAIKTLPAELASDKDRLARFEREAKLLASLNHPHIASVYGLDEHDGTLYLAMELVEGESLEATLRRGTLPIDEALRLALQIAEALEAAHGKGVVHRDLKPANVMVTPDGIVKVLDFGLAKAFSADPNRTIVGQSPALSLAMTQQGLVLGTAAYMSPEQASGQATDQRADVWAFGVVVYEMLTGHPVFSGESVPHILADVLRTEPDWTRLPKDLHPRLKLLLERCLKKRVRDRYHSIADARVDIEAALADPGGLKAHPAATADTSTRSGAVRAAAAVGFVALGAALAVAGTWSLRPPREPAPKQVARFADVLPKGQRFNGNAYARLAISPSGRQLVYGTAQGLSVRELGALDAHLIPGTSAQDTIPVFSPDGQSLAYWLASSESPEGRTMRRISLLGGGPVSVSVAPGLSLGGASWLRDGTIVFAGSKGISRVLATGGEPKLIVPAEEGQTFYGPRLLPDGDSLLFSVARSPSWDAGQIVLQSLTTGERKKLIDGGSDARYVPTGHIVYASGDTLYGVAFDLATRSVYGGAVPLVQGIERAVFNGGANYAVADNGTLAYIPGGAVNQPRTIVWVDRSGREEPVGVPPRAYVYVQLSPDGTRLALDARDEDSDIWIFDLERKTLQRLTFDPGANRVPLWSPDGKRVIFTRALGGTEEIYWQAADGSGAPEPLTADSGRFVAPMDITPDGASLIFVGETPPRDIWMIPVGNPHAERRTLVGTGANEDNAQVSPDGRWIAYQSNESGRAEIYVRPFPNIEEGRWQISTDGGDRPRWRRDGRELFYLRHDPASPATGLMAVTIDAQPGFRPGQPKTLFAGEYASPTSGRASYDISLDGERFLMIKNVVGGEERREIVVVENWFEELKQRVPTK
jgi:Tol biopolymer transport system component